MIADAPRMIDLHNNDDGFDEFDDTVPTLSSKEDIKKLLKGQL